MSVGKELFLALMTGCSVIAFTSVAVAQQQKPNIILPTGN